jgi:hypothetical protein
MTQTNPRARQNLLRICWKECGRSDRGSVGISHSTEMSWILEFLILLRPRTGALRQSG